MDSYVTLYRYKQAIKGGGPERFEKVVETVEAEGGKIHHVYGLLGDYDVISISEFPSIRAAMKATAQVGNLIGAETHTMAALPRDEFMQVLSEL